MTNEKEKSGKMPKGFYLSCERVCGGMSVLVGGIMNVSDFSEDYIMLAAHSGRITVSGRRLKMTVFEGRNIEISGIVEDIKFIYGKT